MNYHTNDIPLPILGITAHSGTGKTTLLKQLIPLLRQQHNIRIGLIKHTHHNIDVDTPGKDSYELRKAGAAQTLVASQKRWALMTETPELPELDLQYLASQFDKESLDLILVEGFKQEPIPKIALYRNGLGQAVDDILDPYVIAIASDITLSTSHLQLDINQPGQIAIFIAEWLYTQWISSCIAAARE
ncbi:molybdopterin-guanine dinucleotide biosynthesis protein MobB [Xenorhabdus szentirmaii]|uniref:Molybdopterin-guanine dinucleotide biosynthesis protein B n=1 Tax=Xenorhabdus szentirmaii DSM 16338 TaxID=1427518 RepID=W1IYH8_9GAMM|nr:molybdopterin-guanine dinucleotide biosynthesis protein MobB [Xenorhabdus szentirmaii]PHM34716.1 molybdopterin-guanine dinucleotide biosynthesis protein MobB [Xenorhabdus szentirmaii DSM 16338]CDL83494.1 Molybdopterin-guanine dinucleotide biosynthesis protein B [Xenorhabdus szentirmaii DSM 16338]